MGTATWGGSRVTAPAQGARHLGGAAGHLGREAPGPGPQSLCPWARSPATFSPRGAWPLPPTQRLAQVPAPGGETDRPDPVTATCTPPSPRMLLRCAFSQGRWRVEVSPQESVTCTREVEVHQPLRHPSRPCSGSGGRRADAPESPRQCDPRSAPQCTRPQNMTWPPAASSYRKHRPKPWSLPRAVSLSSHAGVMTPQTSGRGCIWRRGLERGSR